MFDASPAPPTRPPLPYGYRVSTILVADNGRPLGPLPLRRRRAAAESYGLPYSVTTDDCGVVEGPEFQPYALPQPSDFRDWERKSAVLVPLPGEFGWLVFS